MKNFLFILLSTITLNACAQGDYYTKKGFAVEGYDVTEYFNNQAIKGNKEFKSTYDGVKFIFASKTNKDKFDTNPNNFIPQYGGYCAYAIGLKGKKVAINPKTFEIRDGKLYLFYNSMGINTLNLWNKEGAEKLKAKADINWEKIKNKQRR